MKKGNVWIEWRVRSLVIERRKYQKRRSLTENECLCHSASPNCAGKKKRAWSQEDYEFVTWVYMWFVNDNDYSLSHWRNGVSR